MRLGLISPTGHWQTYAPALEHVAGLTLVAVAPAGPQETMGAFDHAPGLTVDTRRPTGLLVRSRCTLSPTCSRSSPVPSTVKPHPRSHSLKPAASPKSPSRRSKPQIPDRSSRSASRPVTMDDE